jgi:hypothetical protein
MEAASRSALEPLKDELEPLPDSNGPAPVKAANASPADTLSSTQELVSMESLMGWSDLANRAVVETPPQTDSLIPAEDLREEARKLEELLDSLSNSPFAEPEKPAASDTANLKAPSDSQMVRTLNEMTSSLANETAALMPVFDTAPGLSSSSSAPTHSDEQPDAVALNVLEPQDLPLAPLPVELDALPTETAPPEASQKAMGAAERMFAEALSSNASPSDSGADVSNEGAPAPLAALSLEEESQPSAKAPTPERSSIRPLASPPSALATSKSVTPTAGTKASSAPVVRPKPQAVAAPAARAAAPPAVKPIKKPTSATPITPVKPAAAASTLSGTAPTSAPPSAKITPYPNATQAAAAAPNVMDRDFIARNQIVERYLSGKLPVKGATDFERFCHDNPELLDEIGLPQRVHSGLRLLEASGKPEPWQEPKKSLWAKPQLMFAFMGATIALGVLAVMLGNQVSDKGAQIAKLKQDLAAQPLEPAATTRIIRIMPNRNGSSNTPAVTIGGGNAQLCDLRIDMSRSAFRAFRVTIDRIDQGRVAVIQNIYKDSNGHVRVALNSSALGPGNYSFSIDGVTWRGETVPDAWVTIGIQR